MNQIYAIEEDPESPLLFQTFFPPQNQENENKEQEEKEIIKLNTYQSSSQKKKRRKNKKKNHNNIDAGEQIIESNSLEHTYPNVRQDGNFTKNKEKLFKKQIKNLRNENNKLRKINEELKQDAILKEKEFKMKYEIFEKDMNEQYLAIQSIMSEQLEKIKTEAKNKENENSTKTRVFQADLLEIVEDFLEKNVPSGLKSQMNQKFEDFLLKLIEMERFNANQ